MTIALGDDSGSDIERLHKDLSRYCHEHHVYMNIDRFTEGTTGRFARYIELKEGRYYTRVRISDIVYTDIPITISRSIPQAVSCGPICPSKPSFRCLRRTRIFSGAVGTVWSIWIISNRLVRRNFS